MNEVEIGKIGRTFYQIDRKRKFAIPTEFTLSDANIDFYEEHCCASNLRLTGAFAEYSSEQIETYKNQIFMNNIATSISINDIANLDVSNMNPIYININGMIISIDDITRGSVSYSYQGTDDNFCTSSIVEEFTIARFIRLLEETYVDFEYYIETNMYEELNGLDINTDKVLFVFLFNLMMNTFIDIDTFEQVKNDIIEDILV